MRFRFINIRVIGLLLIGMGLGLMISSIAINVRQYFSKKVTVEEYREYIKSGEGFEKPDGKASLGDALYILRIPTIDSENPVREGTASNILSDSLGHESNTAYIGEKGNCVIAGHRNYTFGRFFNRLDEVKLKDLIYVDTPTQTYTYAVKEIKVVEPEDVEILETKDDVEQLTLYTCTPIYIASHRLVIIADRIK